VPHENFRAKSGGDLETTEEPDKLLRQINPIPARGTARISRKTKTRPVAGPHWTQFFLLILFIAATMPVNSSRPGDSGSVMAITEILKRNLHSILQEIDSACRRSGRATESVQLVAVTKYAEWAWVQALSTLHCAFGENRPQQLSERQPLLPDVEWHLIGQLQRNKVRLALEHAAMIHSVDSLRLLERIAEVALSLKIQPRILLQVNVSGESAKSGFSAEELYAAWPAVLDFADQVRIEGLMTMAAESENPEDARPVFRLLRELRDTLTARADSVDAGLSLPELSMGMSGDFVPAVEEGATLIRIGSKIFEGLQPES
jgi:pyridoxal phosphate enzyme (YggS family)